MIIKVKTRTPNESNDYTHSLKIEVDGKEVFRVYDGEPEDANLDRDFNDCFQIPNLMKQAYEAGKNGEKLKVIDVVGEDEEE